MAKTAKKKQTMDMRFTIVEKNGTEYFMEMSVPTWKIATTCALVYAHEFLLLPENDHIKSVKIKSIERVDINYKTKPAKPVKYFHITSIKPIEL